MTRKVGYLSRDGKAHSVPHWAVAHPVHNVDRRFLPIAITRFVVSARMTDSQTPIRR